MKVFSVIFAATFDMTPRMRGIRNSKYMNGVYTWWLKNSYTLPVTNVIMATTARLVGELLLSV